MPEYPKGKSMGLPAGTPSNRVPGRREVTRSPANSRIERSAGDMAKDIGQLIPGTDDKTPDRRE